MTEEDIYEPDRTAISVMTMLNHVCLFSRSETHLFRGIPPITALSDDLLIHYVGVGVLPMNTEANLS